MEEDYTPLALEAVLLFHGGAPWDADKNLRWIEICARVKAPQLRSDWGREVGWDCTTKTLCNIVRAAIAQRNASASDWETAKVEHEITCHSRVIGGVLCRWWGDGDPPLGVSLLDAVCDKAKLTAA